MSFFIHDRQISEYGEADGMHDRNAKGSALNRSANLVRYGYPDIADLATATICEPAKITVSSTETCVRLGLPVAMSSPAEAAISTSIRIGAILVVVGVASSGIRKAETYQLDSITLTVLIESDVPASQTTFR